MIRAFIAIFLVLQCPRPARAEVVEPPIVNPANNHLYYLLRGLTWAETEAEAQSLGGHLVTINDAAENQWLVDNFASFNTTVWIGYNDQAVEDTFVWSSEETPAYTNWGANEPNNGGFGGNEDFGLLLLRDLGSLSIGQWIDGGGGDGVPRFAIAEAAVPESGSFAALLLGSVGFYVVRRRNARKA